MNTKHLFSFGLGLTLVTGCASQLPAAPLVTSKSRPAEFVQPPASKQLTWGSKPSLRMSGVLPPVKARKKGESKGEDPIVFEFTIGNAF